MATGMKLKAYQDMFKRTGPAFTADPGTGTAIVNLALDKLRPFKNHPFRRYTSERFDDLVESVRERGVLEPVIVRPHPEYEGEYEILAGHNRVEASGEAGLETVPALIRDDLNDEEALLIVTETNLIQRSFADMAHSERALTLALHHEAVKKQGRRTDLLQEIELMLKARDFNDAETCAPVGRKLKTRESIGQEYGLSKNTVARYLRVDKLVGTLKKRLDDGEFSVRAGVILSYIPPEEQEVIDEVLDSSHYHMDVKKAEEFRRLSERRPICHNDVDELFIGKRTPAKSGRLPVLKLKAGWLSRYFKPEADQKEIEATIIKALELYFSQAV